MKHIVLYSGGANSAYLAWLLNQEYHEDLILLHNPTYAEHPDADRFREQFADLLDLPITVQEDGRSLWQLIDDNHCLPSNRIPFCSKLLKSVPALKYYKSLNNDDFIVYYGYGLDEWSRAQRSMSRMEHDHNIKTGFPLLKQDKTDKEIKEFIKDKIKVCLPEPYLYLNHNNCLPCFKGGKQHFYQVWKYYPEYYEKAEKAEFNRDHQVFLDKSLTELREIWEREIPMFDDEQDRDMRPCLCAI